MPFNLCAGLSSFKISLSYERASDLFRAMECARESLRIRQTALPPGHQDIIDAEGLIQRLELATKEDNLDNDGKKKDAAVDEDGI